MSITNEQLDAIEKLARDPKSAAFHDLMARQTIPLVKALREARAEVERLRKRPIAEFVENPWWMSKYGGWYFYTPNAMKVQVAVDGNLRMLGIEFHWWWACTTAAGKRVSGVEQTEDAAKTTAMKTALMMEGES